ncbi:MAG: hypothetical protein ACRD4D_01030 [Candidatus Acidiferrales bacterium]
MAKLALLLLAVFALALVLRLLLGLRKFRRRYDESSGPAAERFRRQVAQALPRPSSDEPQSQ